ncbi:MAG: imidazole glycerol phosphate synthase cyclase subunit [Patescibacteria group bacterium]
MLKHRVIPVILIDSNYSVVKTIEFGVRRNLGNPISLVRVYNSRDVDELVILDIDASKEGRTIDISTISEMAEECFMPLTVGGGIKSCKDIENVLMAGADRVVINSAAFGGSEFIKEAADVFGSQCIVLSIDVKCSNQFYAYSHSRGVSIELEPYLDSVKACGAGEIIINSVDRDGKMCGFDLSLIDAVSRFNVPVVLCGGASGVNDCVSAIQKGADAVAISSLFHFTSITPTDCKIEMSKYNIPVRV